MSRRVRNVERFMRDVSDYQETVSVPKIYRAGSRALMIKACEGLGIAGGVRHRERAWDAHALGMRVLHYAFLHAQPGQDQADVLLRTIQGCWKPGDRLVADIEVLFPGGPGEAAGTLETWARRLREHGHTSPIGYTYRAYPYLPRLRKILPSGWLLADYGTMRRPTLLDRLAVRGSTLLGRQFTDGQQGAGPHTCPGVTGPVDCTWLTNNGVKTILQR